MSVVSSSQSWGDAPTSLTTSAAARKVSRTREGQEEGKATQRDDDGEEDGGSHDNVNDMTEGEIYEALIREGCGSINIGRRLLSVERRKIDRKVAFEFRKRITSKHNIIIIYKLDDHRVRYYK
jgi:hypothetical protein